MASLDLHFNVSVTKQLTRRLQELQACAEFLSEREVKELSKRLLHVEVIDVDGNDCRLVVGLRTPFFDRLAK